MTINSQAGGVDAADWAQMLLRMYTRWAERRGYSTEIYDTSYAEEAGIKSATFQVKAPYAYGTLSGEHGTHRLVRISPFDNQGRRQTSFAGWMSLRSSRPATTSTLTIRTCVSTSTGRAGPVDRGQHHGLRRTADARADWHCRLRTERKIPAAEQGDRTRHLQAKPLERRRQEEAAQMAEIRGEATTSWGTQIRSYVLHPYQLVKDLRTEFETGNTAAVLDGEIEGFIEAGSAGGGATSGRRPASRQTRIDVFAP